MNTFKNAVIALLAGLLVLTLSTQNSSGATSTNAKTVEYQTCLTVDVNKHPEWFGSVVMPFATMDCLKYKP